jgi:hypothetical protein
LSQSIIDTDAATNELRPEPAKERYMMRVAVFVMTLLFSSMVFAQVDTGAVQETVRDATGGVVLALMSP